MNAGLKVAFLLTTLAAGGCSSYSAPSLKVTSAVATKRAVPIAFAVSFGVGASEVSGRVVTMGEASARDGPIARRRPSVRGASPVAGRPDAYSARLRGLCPWRERKSSRRNRRAGSCSVRSCQTRETVTGSRGSGSAKRASRS